MALPFGGSWPMSPSWVSVFCLLMRGRYCAQQNQASTRTNAGSSRPLGGLETDLGGLGTSKAEPSPSLQSRLCGAPGGQKGVLGKLHLCRPVSVRKRVKRLPPAYVPTSWKGSPPPTAVASLSPAWQLQSTILLRS